MSEEKLSYFAGLDIGTTAVRCVVGELAAMSASRDSEPASPSIIAATSSPNSGMRKGNVTHVEEVAEAVVAAIAEAERTAGHEIHSVTVNVNGAPL